MGPEPPVLCRNRGSDERGRQLPRLEVHAARAIARQRFVQWYTVSIDHDGRTRFVQIEQRGINRAEPDPRACTDDDADDRADDWLSWWRRGGFDRVERFDNRVELFATRLSEGRHVFTYIVRATTAGTYRTAPARAEEMYEPEVFGRTPTAVIEVRR